MEYVSGFTARAQTLLRVLKTSVKVAQAFDPKGDSVPEHKEYEGIWDTGATGSVINQRVVDELGLKQVGVRTQYPIRSSPFFG